MSLAAVLCALGAFSAVQGADFKTVNTAQGPVRGYIANNVYSFYSIPYATAPTGLDRFKAPLPPPTWTEVYEAIKDNIVCPQSGEKVDENGDYRSQCLVASVFTPNTTNTNLPVVVYVHGGGFAIGYGNFVKPTNLVRSQRVVAVTFNYRLGAYGFLCLGTEAAPGNAGIKDQIALLKWVQKNIASFGGNPNDVTIAGYSAGSASVDLLMISKSAQGLFHKVIPESGANVHAFAVQLNPIKNAQLIAKQLNFTNYDNVNELEKFFLNTPLDILSSIDLISEDNASTMISTCIERDLGQERFLDDNPVNILKSGNFTRYPILYGIAEMEGLLNINQFDQLKHDMNRNFANFLPQDLNFESEEEKNTIAQRAKEFYFGNEPVANGNILKYIDYFSDIMFAHSTLRSAKLQAEAGNNQLYLYMYKFVDEDVALIPHTNVRGADHCAQSFAVLDSPNENNITKEYREMKRVMRELWLNFITTGGSSLPEWRPVTANNLSYMSLNNTLDYKDRMLYERANFWEEIYDKHYRPPAPPNPNTSDSFRIQGTLILSILTFLCLIILS